MIGLINERHNLQLWKETEVTQFFCKFLNFMGGYPPIVIDPAGKHFKYVAAAGLIPLSKSLGQTTLDLQDGGV